MIQTSFSTNIKKNSVTHVTSNPSKKSGNMHSWFESEIPFETFSITNDTKVEMVKYSLNNLLTSWANITSVHLVF